MPPLQRGVAMMAHQRHAIEFAKGLGHLPFTREHRFAGVAPGLQVVRIGTVLDEADDRLRAFKHVAADDAGDALAVRGAIDHQRLG